MMKRTVLILATFGLLWACAKPSPQDMVRKHRREYNISFEFIVSSEGDDVSLAIEVQNNSGGKNLQELTVILKGFDGEDKVLWEKQTVLDVTGLGNYATKEISIKENIPGASANLQGFDISLAPDSEGSGFEQYREFMRVAQ